MPSSSETMILPARKDSLEQFRAFVLEKSQLFSHSPGFDYKIDLTLEELLINVLSYAYADDACSGNKIMIECHNPEPDIFCYTVTDYGCAFNPLEKDAPDTTQSIDDRPIGGLGIHLVRQMSDHLSYERVQQSNRLSVCFRRPAAV